MISERISNPFGVFMLRSDTLLPTLPSAELTLDRNVNPECLAEAVRKALEVYPLMGMSVALEDNAGYYAPNARSVVITSRGGMPVRPGTEAANGHGFSVACDGSLLRMSFLHSMSDGGGMLRFVRTVLYYYFCLEDKKAYAPGSVRTGGDPQETLGNYFLLDYSDTVPRETPPSSYCPPEFAHREKDAYEWGRITLSTEDVLRLSKEYRSSPSVILFLLFARTLYARHPEVSDRVGITMTIDVRGFLNLPETILNCSLFTYLFAEKAIESDAGFAEAARRIREELKTSLTPEEMRRTAGDAVLRGVGDSAATACKMAYLGRFDIGEATPHVLDIRPLECSIHKIDAFDQLGRMKVGMMLGGATQTYLEAMAKECASMGLAAEITAASRIPPNPLQVQ